MTREAARQVQISFTLNGKAVAAEVPTSLLLADYLRDGLELKGLKLSCSRAVCGACTVLVNGRPRVSCATFAFEVDGCSVTTVEGLLDSDGSPGAVQRAFARNSGFQCGYCTAGMITLAHALLLHNPDPDEETIINWISSNVCRCTGYKMIIEAVQDAARIMREEKQEAAQ